MNLKTFKAVTKEYEYMFEQSIELIYLQFANGSPIAIKKINWGIQLFQKVTAENQEKKLYFDKNELVHTIQNG